MLHRLRFTHTNTNRRFEPESADRISVQDPLLWQRLMLQVKMHQSHSYHLDICWKSNK